jgi:trans-aconitate 2-methyltransferase
MTAHWNPDQYLRYAQERERPFWELIARVEERPPRQVVDLGCGPGTATAALLSRWPQARIHGIDSSAAMIEQAATHAQPPQLTFELQDIRSWQALPGSIDLLLSNAALHWVPGHLDLFERWLATLTPEGSFAFQVPRNFDQPSHTLLAQLAASPEWAGKLGGVRQRALDLPSVEEYHERLSALGANVDIWETIYHQVLSGPDPVLEWVRGTALTPYLAALDPGEAVAFESRYAATLRDAYPQLASGGTLFPFKRLFVLASRLG